jgi:hypothetical protein
VVKILQEGVNKTYNSRVTLLNIFAKSGTKDVERD